MRSGMRSSPCSGWLYFLRAAMWLLGLCACAVAHAQSASTTTLGVSTNPSAYGQALTLTATVSGSGVHTGTVTFLDGATQLAANALSNGAASFSTSTLSVGTHSLTAVYAGDATNATSTSAAVAQVVNQVASTMTLGVSSANVSQGENVTLTSRVAGVTPTGQVTFSDGSATLGTATVSGGAATLSLTNLALGTHSITASYAGDANNGAATASGVSVTVAARAGFTWQYGYDAMGRPNTVVDPNGHASYFYYDSLGRRIQSQQPANTGSSTATVIDYGYNLGDDLTSVTDPRSLTTSYSPNGLGNVTAQTSPDTGSTQYTYDANGNVLTRTDARDKTTTYTYDALDRIKSETYATGVATIYEYDGGANPTPAATGELTKITDESGQSTYSYDSMGRLTAKSVTIGSKTFTVGYTWGDSGSALDKLTAITYPSGSRVNYSYDAYGSVSGITVNPVNANGQGVSGTTQTLLSGITYNADNQITGWLWSDGKPRTIGYDSVGMVASYTLGDPNGTGAAAGVLRTITRDAAGRITGYSHTNNGIAVTGLAQTFGYDDLDRLTAASQGTSSTQYSYDATGNRTAKTIAGSTYSNTVSATSNRVTQVQDVLGTATIGYDAAGNTVGDGSFTYTYSDRGRMASVTTASGTVSYLYNGLGQRVQKSGPAALVASGAGYFVYDEAGQPLGEYDATGAPLYETVYLASMPVGAVKITGSAATGDLVASVYNISADHINTPRVITKQDQTIAWRWDSAEAFGATAPDQNPNSLGTFAYNQRFPGQVFDAETGLFQNWNREYNGRTGRYIQSDPVGLRGGINTFAYVRSNPTSLTDPYGLQPVPRGMYLPRGPAISSPPTMSEITGNGTPRAITQQFTNLPNPTPTLPGEYVGINFPWSYRDLPTIPQQGKPYCVVSCSSTGFPDDGNMCKASNGVPVLSTNLREQCTQTCYDTSMSQR
jgi:RHS repeat-associated protein